MSEEKSIREHIHVQKSPYRFQSQVYAPEKNGDGKPRFAVEVMVYVDGSGLDKVNIFTYSNEAAIAFRDYIKFKESMGYKHLGLNSNEITNMLNNIWKTNKWDNVK